MKGGRSKADSKLAMKKSVVKKALNAPSKSIALQIIKEEDPKSYVLQFHNINANLDRIFAVPPTPYVNPFPPNSFNQVPQEMNQWAINNVVDSAARPDRPFSIIIEGPSRVGKTVWARSLGPHNYLCGHLDLNSKVFSNDVWYNVIDNVNPNYLKHWKEFIGAKEDWQSDCKSEKRIVQIKGGIPSIVLCNPGEGSSFKDFLEKEENGALKSWTIRNAKFIFLDETPLYSIIQESSQSETGTQGIQNPMPQS